MILKPTQLKKDQMKDKDLIMNELIDFLNQYYDSLNK